MNSELELRYIYFNPESKTKLSVTSHNMQGEYLDRAFDVLNTIAGFLRIQFCVSLAVNLMFLDTLLKKRFRIVGGDSANISLVIRKNVNKQGEFDTKIDGDDWELIVNMNDATGGVFPLGRDIKKFIVDNQMAKYIMTGDCDISIIKFQPPTNNSDNNLTGYMM